MFEDTPSDPLERARFYAKLFVGRQEYNGIEVYIGISQSIAVSNCLLKPSLGWDAAIIREHLTLISASLNPLPRVTARFTVVPSLCNGGENMHGGATATIFDFITSMPLTLVAKDDFWFMPGVSRTLNVTYLEGVPDGEAVEVEAEAVKIGKKLGESLPVHVHEREAPRWNLRDTRLIYHSSH